MTLQTKAFNWSIGIHVLILFGVFSVSRSMTAPVKVSFIDFSFSHGRAAGPGWWQGGPALSHSRISPEPQSQAIHTKRLATRPKPRKRVAERPEARVKATGVRSPLNSPAPRPVSKRTIEQLEPEKRSSTSVPQPESEVATQQAKAETIKITEDPTTYDRSSELNAQSAPDHSYAKTVREGRTGKESGSSAGGSHHNTAMLTTGPGGAFAYAQKAQFEYLTHHFAYIRDMIMKRLKYPMIARSKGWAGQVKVAFVVRKDGCVEDAKVDVSSGFPVLDKNALETIKKASPFPAPPVEAEIIMPIQYKLN